MKKEIRDLLRKRLSFTAFLLLSLTLISLFSTGSPLP